MRASEKTKLHSVPYDIFYHIVEDIDLSDFNNLSKANRPLYNLLQNDLLAKRTIKVRFLLCYGDSHARGN